MARTKSALVNALANLARKSAVGDITIKELADEAQIGRSTFYEHFACMEDLLRWLVDELVDEVRNDAGQFRLDALLAFVGAMPEVSRAFLQVESCAERCESALADVLPGPDSQARLFAAAGTMCLLSTWLETDNRPPLQDLVSKVGALVEATCPAQAPT